MNNIFSYNDFRKILADYYGEHKKHNPWFSYQVFADKAGIANKGFLHNVIWGMKRLPTAGAAKLSRAMKLSGMEALYFENLVLCNQTKNLKERNCLFQRLRGIRNDISSGSKTPEIEERRHSFYLVNDAAA